MDSVAASEAVDPGSTPGSRTSADWKSGISAVGWGPKARLCTGATQKSAHIEFA